MSGALHVLRGGAGDPLLVLLHGMGANAEVWQPMLAVAAAHWPGRWIAPDLRGHGRSTKEGPFGLATQAADVAALIHAERGADCTILGHSFGGAIGLLVGSGLYGVLPKRVIGFGVKLDWTDEELARPRALAAQPPQSFATREEAAARALAFAGLRGLADPASPVAQAGVEDADGRVRLALAPGVFTAPSREASETAGLCRVPVRLATGEADAMAPVGPMRRFDPRAVVMPGLGHNAHWEAPEAVWRLLDDA